MAAVRAVGDCPTVVCATVQCVEGIFGKILNFTLCDVKSEFCHQVTLATQ